MRSTGLIALCLLVLTACTGGAGERACTLIASQTGIGVEVDAGAPVGPARLTFCVDGVCQEAGVVLDPATGTGSTGCAGGVCSAEVVPTGGRTGFVPVEGLAARPVEVTLALGDREFRTTITPEVVYPNGPDCGGEGVQGRVGLSADGNLSGR